MILIKKKKKKKKKKSAKNEVHGSGVMNVSQWSEWTFIHFGFYHGLLAIIEHVFKTKYIYIYKIKVYIYIYICVCVRVYVCVCVALWLKVLNYEIVVSKFELWSRFIKFTFRIIPLGKVLARSPVIGCWVVPRPELEIFKMSLISSGKISNRNWSVHVLCPRTQIWIIPGMSVRLAWGNAWLNRLGDRYNFRSYMGAYKPLVRENDKGTDW